MFKPLIGHHELRGTLQNLIGRSGSYLFTGPPSVGKRTAANLVAKYSLCRTKQEPCHCKSCQSFDKGHPDVFQAGQSGKVLVAEIESIIDFNSRGPLVASTKITVIDSVEKISPEAANRLLKLLEESTFIFFLISSNPSALLSTVRSRCLPVKFNPLLAADISNILYQRMGFDALSSRTLGWIAEATSFDIFSQAGLILKYRDMAVDLLTGIKNLLNAFDIIDKIEPAFLPLFTDLLTLVMTDLLYLKNDLDMVVNADRRDDIIKLSKHMNDKAIVTSLNILTQLKKHAYLNPNYNLGLKNLMIKIQPLLLVGSK